MPKIQRLFGHAQNTRAVYLFSNGTIQARWNVSLQPEVRGQKLDQRLIDAFETIVAKEVEEQEGERDEDERTTVYRMNEKQAKAVMRRLTAEVWRERKSLSKSPDDAALSRWHRLVTEHFVDVKDDTAAVENNIQLQEALDNVGKNYFTIEKGKSQVDGHCVYIQRSKRSDISGGFETQQSESERDAKHMR